MTELVSFNIDWVDEEIFDQWPYLKYTNASLSITVEKRLVAINPYTLEDVIQINPVYPLALWVANNFRIFSSETIKDRSKQGYRKRHSFYGATDSYLFPDITIESIINKSKTFLITVKPTPKDVLTVYPYMNMYTDNFQTKIEKNLFLDACYVFCLHVVNRLNDKGVYGTELHEAFETNILRLS